MRNELGGKPISISELRKINQRYKGASPKIISRDLNREGFKPEIDPDIEWMCNDISKRSGVSPIYDIEYTPEQGKIIKKKECDYDFLKKEINHVYSLFKKNKLTHWGRKQIKDKLLLYLLWAISVRKYRPEIKLSELLTKKEKKDVSELFCHLVNLSNKTPLDIRFSYMLLDDHFFDIIMDHEKHLQSIRREVCENPTILAIVEKVIPFMEQEVLRRVQEDLIQHMPGRAEKKKMPMDWICLATYVLCIRVFERQAKVKVLKPNTQLCDIWGISPETLKRRLAYLRQL